MKYIVFQSRSGLDIPVLFPDFIGHDELADYVCSRAQSAGFCKPDCTGKVSVWGESKSLNVKSRDSDNELINRAFDT